MALAVQKNAALLMSDDLKEAMMSSWKEDLPILRANDSSSVIQGQYFRSIDPE